MIRTGPLMKRAPTTALTVSAGTALADGLDLLRGRLEAALARLAASSRRTYMTGLRTFASWFATWLPTAPPPLPSLLGGDHTSGEWTEIVLALLAAGPLVAGTVADAFAASSANRAPATVAARLSALRWAFRVARDAGAVAWDLHVRSPKVRAYRDTRGPGLPAAKAMLAVADATPAIIGARDGVLLGLLLVLGLRRAEAASLDVGHFDGARVSVMGKGREERQWISVPSPLVERIKSYLALRRERGELAASAPLLASCDRARKGDGRLSASGLYRRVRSRAVVAGVGRATPHGLRHTGITMALDAFGGDVRKVRRFSRHSKVETVLAYDDERRDVGGEVSAVLAGIVGIGPGGTAGR